MRNRRLFGIVAVLLGVTALAGAGIVFGLPLLDQGSEIADPAPEAPNGLGFSDDETAEADSGARTASTTADEPEAAATESAAAADDDAADSFVQVWTALAPIEAGESLSEARRTLRLQVRTVASEDAPNEPLLEIDAEGLIFATSRDIAKGEVFSVDMVEIRDEEQVPVWVATTTIEPRATVADAFADGSIEVVLMYERQVPIGAIIGGEAADPPAEELEIVVRLDEGDVVTDLVVQRLQSSPIEEEAPAEEG